MLAANVAFAQQLPKASTGCVSGNCVNGRGKMVYDNGSIYEGDFVNSNLKGQGTFTTPNGEFYTGQFADGTYNGKGKYKAGNAYIYEGGWVNGKKEEQGILTYSNSEIYSGQFANDLFNGQGKFSYADGSIYEGNYVNDKINGRGTYTLKNGDYYVGEWSNGKHNGSGKQYSKVANTVWEGTWKDDVFVNSTATTATTKPTSGSIHKTPTITREGVDQVRANMTPEMKRQLEDAAKSASEGKKAADEFLRENTNHNPKLASTGCVSGNCVNGYGKYVFPNGEIYEGNYVNGKKEGQGTYTFTKNETYIGQFADGKRNGQGKYSYADGSVYEGNFVNDKRNGQGTLRYTNGEVFTGQYVDNYRTGKGKLKYSTGDIYEGDFINGKKEGRGTLTFTNGNYYVGEFKNDKPNGFGKGYYKSTDTLREGTWKDGIFADSNAATSQTTDQRIAELTKKIAASPKNDDLYFQRGEAYYQKSDYKSALADAEKALQIDPENYKAQYLKEDAEDELDSGKTKSDTKTSTITQSSEPPKTDAEWQKIADSFKVKIEEAVEKKKDDELAKKIYGDFDQATNGGRNQQSIKYIRRQILRIMFQKGGSKLTSFVLKEMDKLNYTKEDRYVVLNSAIYV